MRTVLVIYHADCFDGFAAAWASRPFLGQAGVTFFPGRYDDPFPIDLARGHDYVYVLDVSWKREVLEEALVGRRVETFQVLDHHDTAEDALRGVPWAIFDRTRSGAQLAWDFFNQDEERRPLPRPWIVDYVGDRDLWRWQLPNSRAVNSYVHTLGFTFPAWDRAAATPLMAIMERGIGALAHQEAMNAAAIEHGLLRVDLTDPFGITWRRVPVVNCTDRLASEVGNALAGLDGVPFTLTWRQLRSGRFGYSLRGTDVTLKHTGHLGRFAQRWGGGGHEKAAGFVLETLLPEIATAQPALPPAVEHKPAL